MTRKTDYGIVLMTHFARHPDRVFHNAREMASEARLPLPIVGQILKTLAREGLLLSHRGTKGGYRLSRSPERISVAEVIRALEGPIGVTDCSAEIFGLCSHEPHCVTRRHWQWINRAFLEAMDRMTLANIALPPATFRRRFPIASFGLAEAAVGSPLVLPEAATGDPS